MTLISPLFVGFVIAGAALVPLGWIVWERRRTSRGMSIVFVRSCFALATLCAVVVAAAAVVNRHYSYILDSGALIGHVSPDLGHTPRVLAAGEREPLHGVVRKEMLAGTGFSPKPLYIYLPPQYYDARAPSRRFPVLYLLHGSPGVAVDWIRTGKVDRTMDSLLRRGAVHPFLIVMPDFDLNYRRDTQCEDIPDGPQMQTYLTRDVVTHIDNHYRTIADRRDRVIGGFSAGAYCGINLTMRHQDVFSAFVSQSGYTTPDENAYTGDLFGASWSLRRQNTPGDYLPRIPIERPLGAYIEAGTGDPLFRHASLFVAGVLRRRGGAITLHFFRGPDHGWSDARAHAGYVLRWASSWFSSNSSMGCRSAPPRSCRRNA